MAKIVGRYELPDTYPSPASLALPPGAKIVHVDVRPDFGGRPQFQVWAEQDTRAAELRTARTQFQMVLTGDVIPDDAHHVASVQYDMRGAVPDMAPDDGERWFVAHLYLLP